VEAGQREFANGELEFYSSATDARNAAMPDVVLLASVLPYLPDPLAVLADLLRSEPAHVLVDRTGFTTAGGSRLTVQRIPRSIYPANYPCWFLDRAQFLAVFSGRYRVAQEWVDDIAAPPGLEFRSFIFERLPA
jgi:putative methyltransferase (TIGR04325 family)